MDQISRAFPGSPVIRTVLSLQGLGLSPTWGTNIPQDKKQSRKKKKKTQITEHKSNHIKTRKKKSGACF